MRTSEVFICFCANFLISLTARGARFLKLMLWILLCRLMVYSRVARPRVRLFLSTICQPQQAQLGACELFCRQQQQWYYSNAHLVPMVMQHRHQPFSNVQLPGRRGPCSSCGRVEGFVSRALIAPGCTPLPLVNTQTCTQGNPAGLQLDGRSYCVAPHWLIVMLACSASGPCRPAFSTEGHRQRRTATRICFWTQTRARQLRGVVRAEQQQGPTGAQAEACAGYSVSPACSHIRLAVSSEAFKAAGKGVSNLVKGVGQLVDDVVDDNILQYCSLDPTVSYALRYVPITAGDFFFFTISCSSAASQCRE